MEASRSVEGCADALNMATIHCTSTADLILQAETKRIPEKYTEKAVCRDAPAKGRYSCLMVRTTQTWLHLQRWRQ